MNLRSGLVGWLGWVRHRSHPASGWRACLAALAAPWRELLPEWRPAPGDAESPLAYLQLGGPDQALIERFAEPVLRVELHGSIVVARCETGDREYAAALWRARIVAVRCWYRARATEPACREQEAVALLDGLSGHRFRAYDDGWLLALPDCPPECLATLDRL